LQPINAYTLQHDANVTTLPLRDVTLALHY